MQAWLHVKGVPAQSQSEKKKRGWGCCYVIVVVFNKVPGIQGNLCQKTS